MAIKESPVPEDRLLRLCEVCDRLKISPSTLWRLVRKGEIKQIRVGGTKRIRASSLEKFLNASEESFGKVKGKRSA